MKSVSWWDKRPSRSVAERNWFHPMLICAVSILISCFFFVNVPIAGEAPKVALKLSHAERDWISKHPEIRLAVDIDWAPFEFVDDKQQYQGMAADYMRLLEERLPISLKVDKVRPWPEMVRAVKNHDLDTFSLVVKTPQRDEFVNFTKPYISFPMVIITLDEEPYIDGINALLKQTVAVVESYASHDLLAKNHPDLKLHLAKNVRTGLEAVSNGQVYAFIGNLAVASQVIRESGLINLKVSGQTPYRFELSMAVRKDWPELVPILQKALDSISSEERDEIYNRWIHVKFDEKIDYRIIIVVLVVGFLIISIIYGWNRKLQNEIKHRLGTEAILNDERQRLKEIIRGTNVGTWEWNIQTGETEYNARWAQIIGYTLEELLPHDIKTFESRVHPEDLEKSNILLEKNFSYELDYYECPIRMRHKDGHWVWVLDRAKVVKWTSDGKPLRMSGTSRDITERMQAESQLKFAASVFTSAREGIMIADPDGIIIDINTAFSRITGYGREEVIGENLNIMNSDHYEMEFYDSMRQELVENNHWSGEIWKRRKNGEVYPQMVTISTVRDDKNTIQHFVSLFFDITEIKNYQRQLERLAHFDPLTGLANRALLADRLRQGMVDVHRRNQKLAVLYIDLDGFKAINDNHGHQVGDKLLISVAHRMKEVLREGDTLSRIGGDEFVAIIADLDSGDSCILVVDRLLAKVAEQMDINGQDFEISASVGITFYPQQTELDGDQLLRQADQAMYQAKLGGKNCYRIFDSQKDHFIKGRLEYIEQVQSALKNDEFVLHYQPKVNMKSGAIIGAEALIRWQHRQRDLLFPKDFHWAFDDHPFSIELGEWVIATALAQIKAWQADGLNIPVSVNISPYHLRQATFVSRLKHLLSDHPDVAPEQLELEVLETSEMKGISQIFKNMVTCQELGVKFALDDFGTGYSSFLHLKQLPVTLIKIDRSFVQNVLDKPDDLAIVQGIMGMAKAFDISVIAEGVETSAHGELLLQLGCELAQGYAIAKAMPAEDWPAWMLAWHRDPIWSKTLIGSEIESSNAIIPVTG